MFYIYWPDAVLLIERDVATWWILPGKEVGTTADFLALRTRQIEPRHEDLAEAASYLQRVRLETIFLNKRFFSTTFSLP